MVDDEGVRLRINGEDITNIYQRYTVSASVFTQPAAFSVTVGDGASVAELRRRFRRGHPVELLVNDNVVARGEIDGIDAHGTPSVVTFRGRDLCRRLFDNTVSVERSFQNETYYELTRAVLDEVGLEDEPLLVSNELPRKHFSKIDAKQSKAPVYADTEEVIKPEIAAYRPYFNPDTQAMVDALSRVVVRRILVEQGRTVRHVVKAKIGTTWWEFLQEQYTKVGIFLWHTPLGFVLSGPNANQEPSYRLLRRRGEDRNAVNVVDASLTEGQPGTHAICVVYGKTGRGKVGRLTCRGEFRDELAIRAGYSERITFEDDEVTSDAEATYVARRRIAEERRNDWRLTYTVAGHSVLASQGLGRGIWAPDTVVSVVDDEYGLDDLYYLHEVVFSRDPKTTTTLHLMRREDLVFAEEMAP